MRGNVIATFLVEVPGMVPMYPALLRQSQTMALALPA